METMKKGGKVKQKQKQKQKQHQTVNVYVGGKTKNQKSTRSSQPPQPPPFRPSFAMQDPGFIRFANPSMQPVPGQPAILSAQQQQLNSPVALNQQQAPQAPQPLNQFQPPQSPKPLTQFQPYPLPRVIPGLFDRPPGEEDVKQQERYQEEEELKEKLREEMEEKEEKEEKEPIMQEPIGAGEAPREDIQRQYEAEKQRWLINKSRELNKMVVKTAKDKSGNIGLEEFIVKQLGITVPREKRSKPDLIRIAMNYYKENYDRLGE